MAGHEWLPPPSDAGGLRPLTAVRPFGLHGGDGRVGIRKASVTPEYAMVLLERIIEVPLDR